MFLRPHRAGSLWTAVQCTGKVYGTDTMAKALQDVKKGLAVDLTAVEHEIGLNSKSTLAGLGSILADS